MAELKRANEAMPRILFAPAFSRSGRWYLVPVSNAEAASVTATTALELVARRSWYFYGGSFFDTAGQRSEQPIDPKFV